MDADGPLIFGNVKRGLDYLTTPDRVIPYKQYVIFPKRPTPYGNQSVYFDLNDATSTTYVQEFSIDCDNPLDLMHIIEHSYGAFWISSTGGKLCEAYELIERPEMINFRIVNTEGAWSSIKISGDKLLGMV